MSNSVPESSAIAQFLQRYERFGIDLGLDRILDLLDRLGRPQDRVPIVHVAGTNGKGSVCAYLSSVLNAAGYRVGRYTSPHLVDWTERICLNDRAIAPKTLLSALHRVEAAIASDRPTPTQFEVLTAATWCIFADAQVDIAAIEVGLGGRLDATNVCDRPLATVITSLSLEHWQRLGPTVADIAREKAGILKTGCPAIIGALPPDAERVVRERIESLGCPAVWPEPAQWMSEKRSAAGYPAGGSNDSAQPARLVRDCTLSGAEGYNLAIADNLSYPLPLLGDMQLMNSALAIATLKALKQKGWTISNEAIQTGMAKTQWPGRLQWTQWQGMKLLIDGAHNPAAAKVLRQYVDRLAPTPVHWLMGMLSTKDHADIFQALLREGDRLTLVPVPEHSSADPLQLAELARSVCPDLESCDTAVDLVEGLRLLQEKALGLKILCGSLYLVGEFLGLKTTDSAR